MIQTINWLDELFLNTDIYGWFGPIGLIVISYIVIKKYRALGIFFFILELLVMSYYLSLVEATPWYWWNIIILVLGVLTCIGAMADK